MASWHRRVFNRKDQPDTHALACPLEPQAGSAIRDPDTRSRLTRHLASLPLSVAVGSMNRQVGCDGGAGQNASRNGG